MAVENSLNWFGTVTFEVVLDDKGNKMLARKEHMPYLREFMRRYVHKLSQKAHKRWKRARRSTEWVPTLAFPELKSRGGAPTLPHYHFMLRLPVEREDELISFSHQYWQRIGIKECGQPIIPHFQRISDAERLTKYILKNIDQTHTIQFNIGRGLNSRC